MVLLKSEAKEWEKSFAFVKMRLPSLKSNKEDAFLMGITDIQLGFNSRIKINFNPEDISSDSGLLLTKEFAYTPGFHKRINKIIRPQIQLSGSTRAMKTCAKWFTGYRQAVSTMTMRMN
jgi:hypothetical protein